MRDVEPVLAAEADEEVVARDPCDLLRLEAEELPDPVILVDDEVAGAQVGEAWRARGRGGGRRAAAACGRPGCRAAGRARARARRSRAAPARPRRGAPASSGRSAPVSSISASARRSRFCVRSASPACGKATTTRLPAADEAGELLLGLGEPARGERRPLRLEGERLRLRERVELGRALQPDRVEPLLRPDAPHLVRLPDEVRHAVEREDEIGGRRPAPRRSSPSNRLLPGSTSSARRSAAG